MAPQNKWLAVALLSFVALADAHLLLDQAFQWMGSLLVSDAVTLFASAGSEGFAGSTKKKARLSGAGHPKKATSRINKLAAARAAPPLRMATFNIQHGAGSASDQFSPEALAAQGEFIHAQRLDIVALQEVDRFAHRSGGSDQVAALSAAAQMPHWRYKKVVPLPGGAHGTRQVRRRLSLPLSLFPLDLTTDPTNNRMACTAWQSYPRSPF